MIIHTRDDQASVKIWTDRVNAKMTSVQDQISEISAREATVENKYKAAKARYALRPLWYRMITFSPSRDSSVKVGDVEYVLEYDHYDKQFLKMRLRELGQILKALVDSAVSTVELTEKDLDRIGY